MNCFWDSSLCELMQKISKEYFYIFGAGVIAKRFYVELKNRNMLEYFCGFIVSQPTCELFLEENVFSIDEINEKDNPFICLAVHDVSVDELESQLVKYRFSNYLWIYPILLEMEIGEPVMVNQWRNPKTIVANMQAIWAYAIYYLAIEDIDVGNGIGQELYMWLYARGCTSETARKRLEKLREIIYNFNRKKHDDFPIRINEEENLIADGAHRLILATYYNLPKILCDIYRFDKYRFGERMKWFMICEDDVMTADFTQDIKEKVCRTVELLRNDSK